MTRCFRIHNDPGIDVVAATGKADPDPIRSETLEAIARTLCEAEVGAVTTQWVRLEDEMPTVMVHLVVCASDGGKDCVGVFMICLQNTLPATAHSSYAIAAQRYNMGQFVRLMCRRPSVQSCPPIFFEKEWTPVASSRSHACLVALVYPPCIKGSSTLVRVKLCVTPRGILPTTRVVDSWTLSVGPDRPVVPIYRGATLLPMLASLNAWIELEVVRCRAMTPLPRLLYCIAPSYVPHTRMIAPPGCGGTSFLDFGIDPAGERERMPVPVRGRQRALLLPDLGGMLDERDRRRRAAAFWRLEGPAFRELQELAWAPGRVRRWMLDGDDRRWMLDCDDVGVEHY